MRIGIIGAGNMGRALGVRWARAGHHVFFGARRPEQAQAAAEQAGCGAQSGDVDEAARFGEVLLWTLRESRPDCVLAEPGSLDGKAVVDLNNRDYAAEASVGITFGEAIAERLQSNAPAARVIKAFNTIAMESFDIDPDRLKAARAQTFVAGDDAAAKGTIARLAGDIGFEAVDAGRGPVAFRTVEAMGDVIRLLMMSGGHGGRAHLRLVSLPEPTLAAVGARQTSNYR